MVDFPVVATEPVKAEIEEQKPKEEDVDYGQARRTRRGTFVSSTASFDSALPPPKPKPKREEGVLDFTLTDSDDEILDLTKSPVRPPPKSAKALSLFKESRILR